MGLSKKQLTALGGGLQVGGVIFKTLDTDNVGADDRLGQAFTVAGVATTQLSAGESVTKRGKAADALDAVGDACKALAAELREG